VRQTGESRAKTIFETKEKLIYAIKYGVSITESDARRF
jgi:hypothetical protein